jgi:flagellar hook-basal body complex protein FliE
MEALMPTMPVATVGGPAGLMAADASTFTSVRNASSPSGASFADTLIDGLRQVEAKVANADSLLLAFARGETIPVHQVTLALEQARISVELAAEVRSRLLETYRDFMNMQL